MASEYRIHKPSVLATLPRPLDHTKGRTVAREVYGLRDGQKKKKRTEVVVGVDGETASIYDIPASSLITSYPIPPQESFTCAPYSVRIRRSGTNDVSRYTYISTRDSTGQKITLFKDVVSQDGKTTSTTIASPVLLDKDSSIQYLVCASSVSETANVGDVIAVSQNGEFVSLSSETLAIQWTSSKSTVQDTIPTQIESFEVDYITSGTLAEFREGIFKDKPDVFSALPKTPNSEPELVALVLRTLSQGQERPHSVVLAVSSGAPSTTLDIQKLSPLEIAPIGTPSPRGTDKSTYEVDVQAALLMRLREGSLSIYDLTTPVPKLKSVVQTENAISFARLSRPFVLSCSSESISLYNHQYRSIHASAPLDLSEVFSEGEKPQSCQFISYLRSQELMVALVDNALVSIQIEPPKTHGKRRKQGLLIDSIGRGTATEIPAKKAKTDKLAAEFSKYVPGSMTDKYMTKLRKELEMADEHLSKGDLGEWEQLLRSRFHVGLRSVADGKEDKDSLELPEWEWLTGGSSYAVVDRRWVLYAIGRTFSLSMSEAPESRLKLQLILPDTNVTSYLVVAGHLTLSNLKAAFRDELDVEALDNKALVEDLLASLADADPSTTLMLNYLQATPLGELELLLAIRALMVSLDLIIDSKKPASSKLLTNEAHDGAENYDMDLDDLERDIAITEYYLGDDSSSRSRGLTLAFAKLWRLPALTTIKAMRTTLKTHDILSLIHTLRVELVRGAWTSLYLDSSSFDLDGSDPPPDGVIALISDLLGRCIDAVGAGGWLFNDNISGDNSDAGDLLTSLHNEVGVALEGIEEVVTINGYLREAVRYGQAAQKGGVGRPKWNTSKPVSMQLEGLESRLLPLGLKTKQLPTKSKVVSGGEVVQRSTRETGHLISQKVEAYSLEKLAI
ncbi:unnamed protein product [Fusarium graminearum]|uniref:Chromosome 1, complete genome n=2 Tax=Gibberella zeae TaxID=5518 RepID=A0A1C3YIY6_GIBZE|nr:hypothetical protein HG531_007616 [Fusarium graminearum]PCD36522.1 hypothetical protein FGRA07_08406 [Fusarium graminearum]CAF3438428.1 unnamed protein product [Fusarium graminearum]CAF3456212.1 unnamed protein product [Fusarium graminearum]CAF3548782.1 unnamed protein product [Fusarium graminearum]